MTTRVRYDTPGEGKFYYRVFYLETSWGFNHIGYYGLSFYVFTTVLINGYEDSIVRITTKGEI